MEKKEGAVPNEQLRRERKLRGWSQNYLAELIGTDPKVVSRWERGVASPTPDFHSKEAM
jgi:transcriptional regulator with XRE-family HTH domain